MGREPALGRREDGATGLLTRKSGGHSEGLPLRDGSHSLLNTGVGWGVLPPPHRHAVSQAFCPGWVTFIPQHQGVGGGVCPCTPKRRSKPQYTLSTEPKSQTVLEPKLTSFGSYATGSNFLVEVMFPKSHEVSLGCGSLGREVGWEGGTDWHSRGPAGCSWSRQSP